MARELPDENSRSFRLREPEIPVVDSLHAHRVPAQFVRSWIVGRSACDVSPTMVETMSESVRSTIPGARAVWSAGVSAGACEPVRARALAGSDMGRELASSPPPPPHAASVKSVDAAVRAMKSLPVSCISSSMRLPRHRHVPGRCKRRTGYVQRPRLFAGRRELPQAGSRAVLFSGRPDSAGQPETTFAKSTLAGERRPVNRISSFNMYEASGGAARSGASSRFAVSLPRSVPGWFAVPRSSRGSHGWKRFSSVQDHKS